MDISVHGIGLLVIGPPGQLRQRLLLLLPVIDWTGCVGKQ